MVTVPPSSRSQGTRITANPQIVSAIMLAALAVLVASLLTTRGALNANLASQPAPAAAAFDQMPLAFIPNAGQSDPQVQFQSQGMGGTLFFTSDAVVLSLPVSDGTTTVRMQFEGALAQPTIAPGTPLAGVVNFIEGSQPNQWHTNVPTYNGLTYHALYNGIDLHYDGIDGRLKSTYLVAAHADPAQIRWRYTGAGAVAVDPASGDLQISLPGAQAPLIERAPIAWQEQHGQRTPVSVRYTIQPDGSIGFALGAYNTAQPLTIDPTLEYSTFIGGSGADRINAVAIDPATGDIFVTGETSSTPFPGLPTNIGSIGPGSFPNVFVARLKADGSGTVYRTVIGGTNSDKGLAIAIDSGIANVTGASFSNDFPTTAATAISPTYNNNGDVIAFALDAAGALDYSTYLGGSSLDTGNAIAVSGNALYIAGATDGVVPGQSSAPVGGTDAIVYMIDKSVSGAAGQIYARRLGGLFNDLARAIALDTANNAYITGITASDNTTFPTVTPLQPNNAGGSDVFITQLSAAGTVSYSSFLGGTDTDEGLGITVEPTGGVVYLTGRTLSGSFPGATGTPIGQDAFITKLNITTNIIGYSRYLGSPGVDVGNAIALDATGAVYVAGSTSSTSFYSQNPLAEMAGNGGNVDGFITRFDPAGNPSYSSRIGGSSDDVATGVAASQTPQGTKVYVAGYTNSSNFPMSTPPTTIQPTIGGSDDGFVVRIANARPRVDLNDANPGNGIDFGPVTWTEAGGAVAGSGPVAIGNASGLTILDSDSATLAYAELRFVATGAPNGPAVVPADGAAESLSVTLSGGITGSYSAGVLRLTAGGASTAADFQTVLRSVRYTNSSQNPTAGQRLIAVEVNDGIDSNTPFAFSTIDVVPTNDPPSVTVPGPLSVNEEATGSITGISVADPDAGAATIELTLSVPVASGTLIATPSGAATVTPASGANIVIAGSLTDVNATLSALSFTGATDFNTNSGGTDSPITLTALASDLGNTPGPALTDQKTVSITVNPINDAPFVPAAPASVTTAEDTAKTIAVVSDLGMNDAKDTSAPAAPGGAPFPPITSVTVTTPPTNGAISSVNLTTGTFIYTPNANYSGADSFIIQVCDLGTLGSACASQTVNVTVTADNDAPVVTVPGPASLSEEGTASITGISVADTDAGSANVQVTLSIPAAAGSLSATASGAASVTPASGASIVIAGSLTDVNATLATLSFTGATDFNTNSGGSDSPATLTVLADDLGNTPAPAKTDQKTVSITVNPINDAPVVPAVPASVTTAEDTAKTIAIVGDLGMTDAKDTSAPAAPGGAPFPPITSVTVTTPPTNGAISSINLAAGTFVYTPNPSYSGIDSFDIQVCDLGIPGSACSSQTVNVTITPVNDPPVVTLSGAALSYTENGAALTIETAPTVNDSDTLSFNGGSLSASITTAGDTGDTITLVAGGNITLAATTVEYSGNPIGTLSGGTNGTALTIAFTSASVTPAVAAELIQQLRYTNTSDAFVQGVTTAKVVTISVSDGGSAPNTGSATRSLNLLGVNDAPVLDNTGTMVLSSISENSNRNNGTLVSAIIASAGGSRISDLDSGALQGIAVIGADTTNGVWQYSTNAGSSWTAFGSLSPTSSTLLNPAARIRFVPNLNFNGNVDPGISFVAWDQTSGLNSATGIDSTPGGGTSAFSGVSESASISVVGVNQAPVLDNSGAMVVTAVPEDLPVASNTGTLVSTLLSSAGGTPITDADTGALQGIAIVGADSSNGSWQFSIDGGTNWTAIGTPSDGTAVLLASDALTRIRFLPNADYFGTVDPAITFRAWDQTSSANGATLVDVSVNGDPSAFSTAIETASITVTPVNDNPFATDDNVNVAKNSPSTSLDVLANDSILPDAGETLAITAVGTAQHGVVTIAAGGTALLYQPALDYSGIDSFTYTISDGNGGSDSATVYVQVGLFYVSLPLVLGEPIQPDLEITSFTITPAGPNFLATDKVEISVTVRNNGSLPTGGFYTELYIDPSVAPTQAGILWNTVCKLNPCYGITWYVQQGLAGGQSVTLTSTNYAPSTRWTGSFAPGTSEVYVYVDSWNGPSDPAGFIKETNESNNMAVIRGLNVSRSSTQTGALPASEQALTADRDVRRDQPLR